MPIKVYNIIIKDIKKPFSEVLKDYELELATQIINAICQAIEEEKSYVEIANIITPHHYISLKSEESYYIDTLEINKAILIKYEEYEMCSKANKSIEIIKKRQEENKNKKYLENKK